MLAALNDLKVEAADIQQAYLNAPCAEKYYIICGPEFGKELQGRKAIVVKALYGLRSAGQAWRRFCSDALKHSMGFEPCKADNDVYMKKATTSQGKAYWIYVLIFTDDILVVAEDPRSILMQLDQHLMLKPSSIGEPTMYLGANIGKYKFPGDDKEYWYMGSEHYVRESVKNVERYLEQYDKQLKSKAPTILPSNYAPELDVSPVLDDELTSTYQQYIGVLRWAVELGRVDICGEVSAMAAFSAMPRRGHLEALFHMFAYLKTHKRSKVVLDSSYPDLPEVEEKDWYPFYGNIKEELPPDMPEPRGMPVDQVTFEDSDHAGDKSNRRSRTGVLMYCNRALVGWYSKKQGSVETSSFGSEMVALKTATELSIALRYKLRMMGVPIENPIHIRGDNMSVITNEIGRAHV